MQMNEVCKRTGLTKKAVEYYQAKGLVCPRVNDNGYREFSDSDLSILKEIALLRKLGLSADEIRQVQQSSNKKHTLALIKEAKDMQAKAGLYRIELMGQLIDGADPKYIEDKLDLQEMQLTIKEKLLMAFPGYYGKYLSLHFGRFLNEPIKTEEQKILFDKIVEFLDNMEPIEIPKDLQSIIDEADRFMNDEKIQDIMDNMEKAYDDFDTYWENNKDNIIQYVELKKSQEYQDSAAAKLMNLFSQFGKVSGYYDVFIPAMRKLSPSYDAYYKKMLEANEKLIQKIPDIQNMKPIK